MRKNNIGGLIWIAIVILFMNGGLLEGIFSLFSNPSLQTERDYNMETTGYDVDITVGEDSTYHVTEQISVDFDTYRHGIYRYIPVSGGSTYMDEKEEVHKIPYHAEVSNVTANTDCAVSADNGNEVLQLGSEYETVYGPVDYEISYDFTPTFQGDDYSNIYYNIYPVQWQNDIPAGSSFTITLPKEVAADQLQFYYGPYGSVNNGNDIADITVDGNVISGTLTKELPYGNGLTLFANVQEGYFTQIHQLPPVYSILLVAVAVLILVLVAILFFFFGRDEQIIPSIQYQPPENLDSAAVGYIVDGVVEDRDIVSLIIYWADKGYLTINDMGKDKLSFDLVQQLPADAPQYQQMIFREMFRTGNHVQLDSLQYKLSETIQSAKVSVKSNYAGKNSLYTSSSKVARGIALVICAIPFIAFTVVTDILSYTNALRMVLQLLLIVLLYVGIGVFCHGIDTWHGKSAASRRRTVIAGLGVSMVALAFYGGSYCVRVRNGEVFNFIPALIVVTLATAVAVILTGFMKKRTHQCIEWMGWLVGLRDFIETAELDRMKAMAQENPQWFYHIIPYAYVFGISDVFARKLQGLALTPPEWYHSNRSFGDTYFDYYIFHRYLMGNMRHVSTTMTTPRPPEPGSGGGGSFGGGGFSGGGFSGGGFSGGGFGGGGGGSW